MNFAPCLWIVGSLTNTPPIFALAVCGEDFRKVPLPHNIAKLSVDLETKLVGVIARRHFKQSGGEIVPFGGRIRYYVYKRSAVEWWALRTDGRVIGRNITPIPPRKHTLHLKRKPDTDISFLFRRRKD